MEDSFDFPIKGEKKPKSVDMSKGKLSRELSGRIVRIKELWEEKENYEKMDRYNSMEEGSGIIGSFVSDIQASSPVHAIDTRDKFSVLRHYNRGVSSEFIQKNIEILRGGYTIEDFGREMDESTERRKGEGDKCREALNASLHRVNEFDRKFKERERSLNKVYEWILVFLFGVPGMYILIKWVVDHR